MSKLLFTLFCFFSSVVSSSQIIVDKTHQNIACGLGNLLLTRSSQQSEKRTQVSLSWSESFSAKDFNFLTYKIIGSMADDTELKSQKVDIREDLYKLSALLGLRYTKIFRFQAFLGPELTCIKTHGHILGERISELNAQLGYQASLQMDYAVSAKVELSPNISYHKRFYAEKNETSYGLSLSYNLT